LEDPKFHQRLEEVGIISLREYSSHSKKGKGGVLRNWPNFLSPTIWGGAQKLGSL